MSVIVKGMQMPENCEQCRLRHRGMGQCNVTLKSTSHHLSGKPMDQKRRPKWCPLVELPEKERLSINNTLKMIRSHAHNTLLTWIDDEDRENIDKVIELLKED